MMEECDMCSKPSSSCVHFEKLIICDFCHKDFENETNLSKNINVNIIDNFIEDGGFDKAFIDVFGLPESVKQRLEDVPLTLI